jgi:hypothetical protein|tara:strand:+ start:434 stop:634 length:201 start_codon:yes stop_codon:yes gene_type:complete
MKYVQIILEQEQAEKLAKLSEATKGNMTSVSIGGEHLEFPQHKASPTVLAASLLKKAIDRAYDQLN